MLRFLQCIELCIIDIKLTFGITNKINFTYIVQSFCVQNNEHGAKYFFSVAFHIFLKKNRKKIWREFPTNSVSGKKLTNSFTDTIEYWYWLKYGSIWFDHYHKTETSTNYHFNCIICFSTLKKENIFFTNSRPLF